MQPTGGEILEGKVVGITKFGAFVSLADGRSGLVHISEIANTYVNDVHDHLAIGQTVKVVIISESEDGKINLSIKRALEPEPRQQRQAAALRTPRQQYTPRTPEPAPAGPSGDASFEDKLKQFMHDSDSKIAGNKMYADKKGGGRRRRDR